MKEKKFRIGENVVYPSHKGIGVITAVEEEKVAGFLISVYKIKFSKDNMVLHVPLHIAIKSGLRSLNSKEYIDDEVISVLQLPLNKKEEAWRACSVEYENKLQSGDLILLAEIVRDLSNCNDSTYSRRNIYEIALDRLASEVSLIYNITYDKAKDRLLRIAKGIANTIIEEVVDKKDVEEVFS